MHHQPNLALSFVSEGLKRIEDDIKAYQPHTSALQDLVQIREKLQSLEESISC